ncbi:hypothetical protein QE152_g25485 [Popillia japonica]|uniref:Uncharacterized protein n=1 Tax=Popillia japonica TaxID=7064 RepID=A0AAW1K1X7_POPJA
MVKKKTRSSRIDVECLDIFCYKVFKYGQQGRLDRLELKLSAWTSSVIRSLSMVKKKGGLTNLEQFNEAYNGEEDQTKLNLKIIPSIPQHHSILIDSFVPNCNSRFSHPSILQSPLLITNTSGITTTGFRLVPHSIPKTNDTRLNLYENEQEMLQKYMDEVMMELECERKNELNERCLEDSEEDNDSEIDYLEESDHYTESEQSDDEEQEQESVQEETQDDNTSPAKVRGFHAAEAARLASATRPEVEQGRLGCDSGLSKAMDTVADVSSYTGQIDNVRSPTVNRNERVVVAVTEATTTFRHAPNTVRA